MEVDSQPNPPRLTKSRVNQVLSSLSSPPSTSSPTFSSSIRKSKSHLPVSPESEISTPALSSLLSKKKKRKTFASPTHGSDVFPSPNPYSTFSPTSLPDLLSRLSTYKLSTFTPPSNALSPLDCSMRGWVNTSKDTIECGICRRTVNLRNPQVQLMDLRERLKVGEEHDDLCPWKRRGCSREIYRLSISSPNKSKEDLLTTLTSRCSLLSSCSGLSSLPILTIPSFPPIPPILSPFPTQIILLSIFNWLPLPSLSSPSTLLSPPTNPQSLDIKTSLLGCSMCFRLVGGWTISDAKPFDAMKSHREYCPVICNPNGKGGFSEGWRELMERLGEDESGERVMGEEARREEVREVRGEELIRSLKSLMKEI